MGGEGEAGGTGEQVRLEGGQHVVLLIGAFEAAVGRIEAGFMQVGLVLKADKDGDVVVARGLFKDGVGLGEVVALCNAGDFFGKDDDLRSLGGEGGDLGDVVADKVDSGWSLRGETLVGRD